MLAEDVSPSTMDDLDRLVRDLEERYGLPDNARIDEAGRIVADLQD